MRITVVPLKTMVEDRPKQFVGLDHFVVVLKESDKLHQL